MPTNHKHVLLSHINDHSAAVGIIGLGYVGLPLALAFVEKGFTVLGFDVDGEKVAKLERGEPYIKHLDGGRVESAAASGRLHATTDFSRLGEPDAILICVPTPLTPQREPDMTYVEQSAWQIARALRPGQLVILESTTYPGTTDELVRSILESPDRRTGGGGGRVGDVAADFTSRGMGGGRDAACGTVDGTRGGLGGGCVDRWQEENGEVARNPRAGRGPSSDDPSTASAPPLRCGTDYFLAFSPEREDPGNKNYGTTNTPKVVGGVDETSGDLAQALYDQIILKTVRVSSARAAEAAKLTENIFRAVNIALVNELKIVYDKMGIDIWEVLDAAETKPFGFMRFNPGPGWGGHCIPLDPFYLAWKAREYGVSTKFIELAGEVNVRMPEYVVERLQKALNDQGKPVKGSKVLILGLAYKKDIDDPRESPAFEIIDLLLRLGAEVSYHDPHIPVAPSMRSWPGLPPMRSVELSTAVLSAFDAGVIVTDHTAVDYAKVRVLPLVVDTRGLLERSSQGVVRA